MNLHTRGYRGVSLNAAPAAQSVKGSVAYLFYPTLQPPEVDATRDQIETAYDRRYLRG
jgi:hypothetical protein